MLSSTVYLSYAIALFIGLIMSVWAYWAYEGRFNIASCVANFFSFFLSLKVIRMIFPSIIELVQAYFKDNDSSIDIPKTVIDMPDGFVIALIIGLIVIIITTGAESLALVGELCSRTKQKFSKTN